MKRALITGITGQDGSYLAELLLSKGYVVFGLARPESWYRPNCSSHLAGRIEIIFGDVTEGVDVATAIQHARPHEIYNLASQSRPGESWSRAPETLLVNGVAAVRLFEAVRQSAVPARIYHASSSEMFGRVCTTQFDERTPFNPVNPYAAAKVCAHQMAGIYRNAHGMYVASGILFNHESERRQLHFLVQKIAHGAACASLGIVDSPYLNERGRPIVEGGRLALGNLDVSRDWGYAPDFVRAMWLIMQQDEADDFVIGTGRLHTLRELAEVAYRSVGRNWEDSVFSAPDLVRPQEPPGAVANPSKANRVLGWHPSVTFEEMIHRMVESQVANLRNLRHIPVPMDAD